MAETTSPAVDAIRQANRESTSLMYAGRSIATHREIINLRETALGYARRGWQVLPLHTIVSGRCTCGKTGCKPGKHPNGRLVRHGFQQATTEETIIRRWWALQPRSNVGIALGLTTLFIIGPDSVGWHEEFQRRGLPRTAYVRSGSGEGHYHYYYRRPLNCPVHKINRSGEYDIMTQGLMVAPPSLHLSGRRYEWIIAPDEIDELPEAPAWAVEELIIAADKRPDTDVLFSDAAYSAADVRGLYRGVRQLLPPRVAFAIECGPSALRSEDRSGIDYRVVCELVRCEFSNDLIRAIFQYFPIGQQGKYDERGDRYLATTIRNARSAAQQAVEAQEAVWS